MPIIIENKDESLVAYLKGEIDHHNAVSIRQDIDFAVERHKPKELILDFEEVNFMDSSGIGLVMGRYKITKEYGGKVVVANSSAQIKKVMKLAGLEKLATIN